MEHSSVLLVVLVHKATQRAVVYLSMKQLLSNEVDSGCRAIYGPVALPAQPCWKLSKGIPVARYPVVYCDVAAYFLHWGAQFLHSLLQQIV